MRSKMVLNFIAIISALFCLPGLVTAMKDDDINKPLVEVSVYTGNMEMQEEVDFSAFVKKRNNDINQMSQALSIPALYSEMIFDYNSLDMDSSVFSNVILHTNSLDSDLSAYGSVRQISVFYDPIFNQSRPFSSAQSSSLPEPVIMLMVGIGLVCFAGYARRRGGEKK